MPATGEDWHWIREVVLAEESRGKLFGLSGKDVMNLALLEVFPHCDDCEVNDSVNLAAHLLQIGTTVQEDGSTEHPFSGCVKHPERPDYQRPLLSRHDIDRFLASNKIKMVTLDISRDNARRFVTAPSMPKKVAATGCGRRITHLSRTATTIVLDPMQRIAKSTGGQFSELRVRPAL